MLNQTLINWNIDIAIFLLMMIETNMTILKEAYRKPYPLKIDTIVMMFINIAKYVDKKDIQRNFVFSKKQVNV